MSTETKQLPVLQNPEEVQRAINNLFSELFEVSRDLDGVESEIWWMLTDSLIPAIDPGIGSRRCWFYKNLMNGLTELYKFKQ